MLGMACDIVSLSLLEPLMYYYSYSYFQFTEDVTEELGVEISLARAKSCTLWHHGLQLGHWVLNYMCLILYYTAFADVYKGRH